MLTRPQFIVYALVTTVLLYSLPMMILTSRAADEPSLASLDPLRWERRVILVFASRGAGASIEQRLEAVEAQLQERDVSWVLMPLDGDVRSNHEAALNPAFVSELRERLAPIQEPLDVLLIGKDGGLKGRDDTLNLNALFTQIDGMPMRQREQRERAAAVEGGSQVHRP
ncbi:MAG: DUF4174 domain-containing protein [Pseudomonadota bacterium]